MTNRLPSPDVNVVALVKGQETYTWLFHDSERSEVLLTMGRFAANHELSFTWKDAAYLSQRIRETVPA